MAFWARSCSLPKLGDAELTGGVVDTAVEGVLRARPNACRASLLLRLLHLMKKPTIATTIITPAIPYMIDRPLPSSRWDARSMRFIVTSRNLSCLSSRARFFLYLATYFLLVFFSQVRIVNYVLLGV